MNKDQLEALREHYPCCGCGKCIGIEEILLLLAAFEIQTNQKELINVSKVTKCDNCDKMMISSVITLNYGYGSCRDGDSFDYCSDKCCVIHINNKLKKQEIKGDEK